MSKYKSSHTLTAGDNFKDGTYGPVRIVQSVDIRAGVRAQVVRITCTDGETVTCGVGVPMRMAS